jgi:hypothetical protein
VSRSGARRNKVGFGSALWSTANVLAGTLGEGPGRSFLEGVVFA